MTQLVLMLVEAAAQPQEKRVMVAFTRRRSLPAVQAAKPREVRCLSWSDDSIYSQLRSLPAVQAAKPGEVRCLSWSDVPSTTRQAKKRDETWLEPAMKFR